MSWRRKRCRRKNDMTEKSDQEFNLLREEHEWLAGIDEAGWGPVAGPLLAAVVVLPKDIEIPSFIKDSKKLSESKREEAYSWIMQNAEVVQVASANVDVFSEQGASFARRKVFTELLHGLQSAAERRGVSHYFTLIDGNYVPVGFTHTLPVIKGDSRVAEIAAASIVAKVVRDTYMCFLDMEYPEFGWNKNKGYLSALHKEALETYGATPYHRKNVKRVREAKIYGSEAAE